MIFDRIVKAFNKKEEVKETAVYHLAEQIIREALNRGSRIINLKCWPKEKSFGEQEEFLSLVEGELDAPLKIRPRDYDLCVFLRGIGYDKPFMSLPVNSFLPLLNILSAEKTEYKGKQCFPIYGGTSSPKKIEKYLDLTLYLESDSSISIDFQEIK